MKLKKVTATLLVSTMLGGLLIGCGGSSSNSSTKEKSSGDLPYDGVTITLMKDADCVDDGINAVVDLAEEKLGLKVEIEQRVGGTDGDNIVKTRLASGDMSDICLYNSGSLLAALNPSEYFVDLSGEEFADTLDETYKSTVTIDGALYGVPVSSTQAGAIVYYKPDYEELGLEVPKTWDEFIANCDALQKAGKTAVLGTFGDSWTSQVMYLGDNYNVLAANPNFAEEFEAGTAKYATTPEGVASFQKLADVQKYYNEDYLAATYDDGCDMIPNGEATHWVILTQALSNMYSLYPEAMDDIGVFAIPGDDAEDNGLTVWMPSSLYVNKDAENMEAVMAFINLYVSEEGLDAYSSVILPDGPYCVKGYELPENAYPAVKEDMQAYFDAGKTKTALEFLTSVKGSNCASICVEVGSGQSTAEEAAKAYDEDCKKQAVQLGLDWK